MKNYRIFRVLALALLAAASGGGGLFFEPRDIFCMPSLNLDVAFTGQNYESGEVLPFTLMQDYILRSID